MDLHIGNRIKEILLLKGLTAYDLARMIPCSRENVYKLMKTPDLNTSLLRRISKVLEHDFFLDVSEAELSDEDSIDDNTPDNQ